MTFPPRIRVPLSYFQSGVFRTRATLHIPHPASCEGILDLRRACGSPLVLPVTWPVGHVEMAEVDLEFLPCRHSVPCPAKETYWKDGKLCIRCFRNVLILLAFPVGLLEFSLPGMGYRYLQGILPLSVRILNEYRNQPNPPSIEL